MKKKLTTAIHKFIDIEGCEIPKGLVKKLANEKLYTYKDTIETLNEDYILKIAKELLNYDYEQDKVREDFCLNANIVEIWQYWLKVIIPSL